jgi:hypothetical protein
LPEAQAWLEGYLPAEMLLGLDGSTALLFTGGSTRAFKLAIARLGR